LTSAGPRGHDGARERSKQCVSERVMHSVGNVVQALTGKPRSSEYDNELEQDPRGHEHGSGSNDDMWGEWCALVARFMIPPERDAPHHQKSLIQGYLVESL
jgi:hypothetical protein